MSINWEMALSVALGFILAAVLMKFVLPQVGVAMFDEND